MSKDDLRFDPVDGESVLRALAALRISTWRYRWEADTTRHVGPSAEDFEHAFHFDTDERLINPLDASGVALAGVQALMERLDALEAAVFRLASARGEPAHADQVVDRASET